MYNDGKLNATIRLVVDPLIMKLRDDLYGSMYNGSIAGSAVPTTVINEITNVTINELVESGDLAKATGEFTAGAGGTTAGRIVYYNSGIVRTADCTDITHAGKIVGLALDTVASGVSTRVRLFGEAEFGASVTSAGVGIAILGTSGQLVDVVPSGAAFVQRVGTVLAANRIIVTIDPSVVII